MIHFFNTIKMAKQKRAARIGILCVLLILAFSKDARAQFYYKTNFFNATFTGYKIAPGKSSYKQLFLNRSTLPNSANNAALIELDTNLSAFYLDSVAIDFQNLRQIHLFPGDSANMVFASTQDDSHRIQAPGFPANTYLRPVTYHFGELINDSTLNSQKVNISDTIYAFEGVADIMLVREVNDKIFVSFNFFRTVNRGDSMIRDFFFGYYDMKEDSLFSKGKLVNSIVDPWGTHQRGVVIPFGDLKQLPNGDWIVDIAFGNDTINRKFIAHMGANFDTIYQVWPTSNFLLNSHIWLDGENIYHYATSTRLDPNYPRIPTDDISLSKINRHRDTLVNQHFIELRDSTKFFQGEATNGAYFDGEHFVLSSWSELNPSFNYGNIALDLFTLDTNFKVVHHKVITDSSFFFDGAIQSIVPKIGDSTRVVYSGYARNPSVHPNFNLFWGEYSIVDNTVGLEAPIKIRRQFLQVYPNPSLGKVTVVNQRFDNAPYQLQLLSIDGKLLKEYNINKATSTLQIEEEPGTYILKWVGEEYTEVRKIIIR